ncbi:MAG: hypothetical protein KIS88_08660 [Anaerolineales bacterium]|nr:hypothetical protein [Anaerolineales bacterium]
MNMIDLELLQHEAKTFERLGFEAEQHLQRSRHCVNEIRGMLQNIHITAMLNDWDAVQNDLETSLSAFKSAANTLNRILVAFR